jgi:peptidoglycan/xylan/chitin deacetylase (PgdA/CDA1 family)
MFRSAARTSLDRLDRWWAHAWAATRQGPQLAVALFHVVHRAREDARTDALAPNQEVTVDDLRRFLDAMLRAGYTIATGTQLRQSGHHGKLLLLTFDDGYYNNTRALPVLEEFQAPATFFISTSHVLLRKAYWWDVVSRRLRRAGKSRTEVDAALQRLKALPVRTIEERLRRDLGAQALAPVGDVDRPFDPIELRDFARSRWVTLGNHTAEHTILTRCSPAEAEEAMRRGKEQLESMTGIAADAIAYPNGNFSAAVVRAARTTGHEIGFTCAARANPFPLDERTRLTLGRHLIWGGADYDALAPQLAAPFLPGAMLRAALRQSM